MKIIGITGGIGSGKSTIMNILKEKFHAGIIIADDIGHLSMKKDTQTYRKMIETFGKDILDENFEIDRNKLASIIFSSDEMLKKQNDIVHPFVHKIMKERIESYEKEGRDIVAIESAILHQSGCYSYCEEIWLVAAKTETRIKRLMESRGYSREKAVMIMKNQPDDREYENICDYVIHNDGNEYDTYKQIKERLK